MKLTPKQELFISEYMKDLNAAAAYIRAGYKVSPDVAKANASRLLTNANVKNEVEKRLAERAKNNGITAEYVLQGIKSIADDMEAKHNDKLKAFELLGKHLKLFTDKTEVENNINGTISVKQLTSEERKERIEELKKKLIT